MRFVFISCLFICFCACQKEIDPLPSNNNSNSDTVAAFNLTGAPNDCSHVVPFGTYKKALPLISSNKLTVDVNVTKVGRWTASTDTVNGISFSGTARFTATGNQAITLNGSGTPVQSGAQAFKLNAGFHHCSFTLLVDTNSSTPLAVNIPPIVNAGPDISATWPLNTVSLIGSATDADGTIAAYAWSKIAGPAAFNIVSPTQAQTVINSLAEGNYEFELKATDNSGAVSRDTVSVFVYAAAATGSLNTQLSLFAVITPPDVVMHYDGSGRIIAISSNYYPDRRINYSNNKIATIEFWYDVAGGTQYKGQTRNFLYDVNGNVIKINETDHITGQSFLFAEFEYNSDNSMKSKKLYFSSGSTLVSNAFAYNNGNLVAFLENVNSAGAGDTTVVGYDNRANNFKNIYPQYYFLDTQTEFDPNYRSEVFYFSNNYPVNFGTHSVAVGTSVNQKPFEIRFDNSLWYRYVFN